MALPRPSIRNLARRSEGAAALEFGLVITFLMVIVMGAIDFGHAWYMKQVVTNASREGARYAVALRRDGTRPSGSDVQNWVLTNALKAQPLWPADAAPEVTLPNGTSGTVGATVIVRVTATKTWWVANNFIPGLGENVQLGAETTMRVE